jgi:phosphoribosylglycinamide formyltransferase-1
VISKIICNYSGAKVLDIARNEKIESIIVSKDQLDTDGVLNLLKQLEPDLIVLAGFLLKMPKSITDTFNIVNLHPSLLPKFGGKGMYGMNVHKAVIKSFEEESGITIHWVNENYDEGNIIKQYKCRVSDLDTPETLSEKIKDLELNYPSVIKSIL